MTNIPKFGGWENDNNVTYTVFFENVRTGRGGGKAAMDPNDPQKSPVTSRAGIIRPNSTNNPQPKHKPGQEFQYSEKVQQQSAVKFHLNTPSPARFDARAAVSARRSPNGRSVPKFGEWENSSSAPAEGYTVIFNKVREEVKEIKNGGSVNVQANNDRDYNDGDARKSQMKNGSSTKPSCFGCLFGGM